jgi:hypothetical protein
MTSDDGLQLVPAGSGCFAKTNDSHPGASKKHLLTRQADSVILRRAFSTSIGSSARGELHDLAYRTARVSKILFR